MKQYLKVTYLYGDLEMSQDFKLSEVRFINTILKDQPSHERKCKVELKEIDKKGYELIFG
jgi:hypothetical protein